MWFDIDIWEFERCEIYEKFAVLMSAVLNDKSTLITAWRRNAERKPRKKNVN